MGVRRAVKTIVGEPSVAKAHELKAKPRLQLVRKVEIDRSRDALLTDFGRTTLEDRYLLAVGYVSLMFAFSGIQHIVL